MLSTSPVYRALKTASAFRELAAALPLSFSRQKTLFTEIYREFSRAAARLFVSISNNYQRSLVLDLLPVRLLAKKNDIFQEEPLVFRTFIMWFKEPDLLLTESGSILVSSGDDAKEQLSSYFGLKQFVQLMQTRPVPQSVYLCTAMGFVANLVTMMVASFQTDPAGDFSEYVVAERAACAIMASIMLAEGVQLVEGSLLLSPIC